MKQIKSVNKLLDELSTMVSSTIVVRASAFWKGQDSIESYMVEIYFSDDEVYAEFVIDYSDKIKAMNVYYMGITSNVWKLADIDFDAYVQLDTTLISLLHDVDFTFEDAKQLADLGKAYEKQDGDDI